MAADKDSDIKTVQVLDRAVKILDVVAAGSDPVNSNRIVQETGIHASTAHRLLWSLTSSDFWSTRRKTAGVWACGFSSTATACAGRFPCALQPLT